MKKFIMPIVMATTLTVKATDTLNLPFSNAYDHFVCHMEKFKNCRGSELFVIKVDENNYQQTFLWIKRNLGYTFFQHVIDYTLELNRANQYLNFYNCGLKIQDQYHTTENDLTVQNVEFLIERIKTFSTAFASIYFKHQIHQQ
jgi:hypothetical protein